MVGKVREDTRLADVRVRSWLWLGAGACVLLGTLWVVRTRRERSRVSGGAMLATTGGQEAEIVVGNGASSGTARRWIEAIGTLAAFTAVFFIYSMAR